MASVIELEGVSVRRGNNLLLDDINLRVSEGERWVVVGPNGAGKTTLLSLLSAQNHPSAGRVTLLGETLGRVDVFELRPRIGVSSQLVATRIPSDEQVRDVVLSAAYAVLGRWNERYEEMDYSRADELLRKFRVDALADRTFGTLSEGERKRVEIARALMSDPELLLLDEPGAGLDLAGRELLVGTLSSLFTHPDSPVTVLVSHHLEEIPAGITHALLLRGGRQVAVGLVAEVLTADNLSQAFGMKLRVTHEDGRWSARAD